jgi:competence protein ComEC
LPPLWIFPPLLAPCLFRFPGRILIAVALAGAAYTTVQGQWLQAQRLSIAAHGEEHWLRGHVEGLSEAGPLRTRFQFVTGERPRRIRVSWYHDPPKLRPGACWRLRLKLRAPHGSLNPGGFDYEAWLWRERIGATGYVRDAERCTDAAAAPVARRRHAAVQRLSALLDGHPMTGPLLALSLGDRSAIDDQQWRVLRRTGTSHLLAISGLHVGLIAGVIFWGLRRLVPRLYPRSRPSALALAAIGTGLAAAGYAALAGFALPTQRALIMVLVVLAAVLWRRRSAPSQLLALAALAVLILDPFAVMAPGFWLSFGAVAWILYLLGGRLRTGRTAWFWLQPALVLGLLPWTLFWFGEASLMAALANAVLIPAFVLLVPAVLATVVLTLVLPAAGTPLLLGLAALFDGGWAGLALLAELPGAYLTLPAPDLPGLVLALAGAAWLLAPRGVPGRWLGVLGLLPLLLAAPTPESGGFRLTLLDVGQGLAAVVRTSEHALLFDAGPRYRTGFDAGEAIVVPYLRARGVRRLDRLLLSHGDIDHRGGVAAVRDAVPVAATLGVDQAAPCRAGESWRWDGVDFRVLHPDGPRWRGNDASCVLAVSGPGGRALLTGDIEAAAERHLVTTRGAALGADVLVVPHHGSASSSTAAFLDAVSPIYALVPAGWRNRWGFPAPAVTERLRATGATVRVSGRTGALRVEIDPQTGVAPPVSQRKRNARFWHARMTE